MDTDKFIGYAKDAIMLYYHSTLKTEINLMLYGIARHYRTTRHYFLQQFLTQDILKSHTMATRKNCILILIQRSAISV